MKYEDFFNLGLPKWPCLLVTGAKVTKEQAAVILIRTDNLQFSCNDSGLERRLRIAVGFSPEAYPKNETAEQRQASWDKEEEIQKALGILPLSYLDNNRIVSCWIGGPHGWCDWNGNIFCNNFNIGKWPSVKDVFEEWKLIAKAFPFLDLKSQLLNQESCEETPPIPVVQFNVKNGKARMTLPTKMLMSPTDVDFTNLNLPSAIRESGCTMEQFKNALELTKASFNALQEV